jgi:hypothetical protein
VFCNVSIVMLVNVVTHNKIVRAHVFRNGRKRLVSDILTCVSFHVTEMY